MSQYIDAGIWCEKHTEEYINYAYKEDSKKKKDKEEIKEAMEE
ncbi:hypothetical protein [Tindallia californiensis]|nr:hypothetical protein [Tindallia californiensis]